MIRDINIHRICYCGDILSKTFIKYLLVYVYDIKFLFLHVCHLNIILLSTLVNCQLLLLLFDEFDYIVNCTGYEAGALTNDQEITGSRGQIYRANIPKMTPDDNVIVKDGTVRPTYLLYT